MWKHIVVFAIMLVAIQAVIAADADTTGSQTSANAINSANKFLSAEASRQIKQAQDESLEALKAYQDENFQIFDARMSSFMHDMRIQIILAAIGSFLVAGAIVTLIIIKSVQKYSFERYLENNQHQPPMSPDNYSQGQYAGMQELQQNKWDVQAPSQYLGTVLGPQQAAQSSQMNQWQVSPPYAGAWVPPNDGSFIQESNVYKQARDDPMNSPGWSPEGRQ